MVIPYKSYQLSAISYQRLALAEGLSLIANYFPRPTA
jgi:hypothetical protein